MNKQKVEQILQIEEAAQKIRTDAQQTAKQMLVDAQNEVEKLHDQVHREAEQETEQILNQALSKGKSARILDQSRADGEKKELLAKQNFDKAVDYVLEQIVKQG